ncbi:MAG: hypothetical protein HOP29_08475 [Phycisphaerales bacterium]|nr:hypothetical protein [Phycisphaerales bacterium]
MAAPSMDFDTTVKTAVYRVAAESARMPGAGEVAREIGAPVDEVIAAFERLHEKRLLVPEPGVPARVRMAPPFSGVETPFLVRVNGKGYYANCVWDALGVAAALHADAVVEASDGHTGEPMGMEFRDGAVVPVAVRDGAPLPMEAVAHFAVPAARWWADIIFT